jgi:hypothetical protein
MLQAQLEGKLTRREEEMEDLLTSNVFGSLKYVQPEEGLLPLLSSSEDIDGNAPIDFFQTISDARYKFWPKIKESGCNGCEPDVLITIRLSDGQKILLLVEAKYLSDKSSKADSGEKPMDQLAREWDNLKKRAQRKKANPILLYITADISYPKDCIEDSNKEFTDKRSECMKVFWISWRRITNLFHNAKQDSILSDLVKLLKKQGLTFFEGITNIKPVNIKWSFRNIINWNWLLYEEYHIEWKFKINKD